MDLFWQVYMLPHWDTSCRSNFLSHPFTNIDTRPTSPSLIMPGIWQGSHWSANFSGTGMTQPWKSTCACGIRTPDLPLSRQTPYPQGQQGGLPAEKWYFLHHSVSAFVDNIWTALTRKTSNWPGIVEATEINNLLFISNQTSIQLLQNLHL